jgi:hypothetical protein
VDFLEEALLPLDEMQGVDIVDFLLALVDLAFHPVAVEVSEEMVDVLGRGGVAFPFACVEAEEGLFGVILRGFVDVFKVAGKVETEEVVELFAEKVG